MPKLPRIPAALVIRTLKRAGFYEHHQTGSHLNLRHSTKHHLRLTIPSHKQDLSPKTLKSIILQSEMTVEEFVGLLS